MGKLVTRLATTAATTGAVVVARKAAESGWRASRGEAPPTEQGRPRNDAELRDLLLWTVLLGTAVVLARRVATSATRKLLGPDE